MTGTVAITFRTNSGERTVDVPLGHTLMEAGRDAGVDGIIGECGGTLACGTCHVRIVEARDGLPEVTDAECEMLEFAEVAATDTSRLCCQITAVAELNGLVVEVAES